MEVLEAVDISKEAIFVLLKVSLPLLLVALGVGVTISLLQALTQIQEPTLAFIPKIIAVFITLLLALPYIGNVMGAFMTEIFAMIIHLE